MTRPVDPGRVPSGVVGHMSKLSSIVVFGALLSFAALATASDAAASHASNANTQSGQGSYYKWWGVVGYIKGATGVINNPNSAVVAAWLSADALTASGQQWAQIGVYRGTAGDIGGGGSCPFGECIRNTSSTPRIYTENRFFACGFEDYSIYSHGNQPSANHGYWNYWTGVTQYFCGVPFHQYRLAKTHSNGWPNEIRLTSIGGSDSKTFIGAALEVHNRGAEQNPGLNCFGATYSPPPADVCGASTNTGLHLYAGAYGWPLWHNNTDPTNGVYHWFNGTPTNYGCYSTFVPYRYEVIGLAFWWSSRTYHVC